MLIEKYFLIEIAVLSFFLNPIFAVSIVFDEIILFIKTNNVVMSFLFSANDYLK